jgi:hypothetical protein
MIGEKKKDNPRVVSGFLLLLDMFACIKNITLAYFCQ